MQNLQDAIFTIRLVQDGNVCRQEVITPDREVLRRQFDVDEIKDQATFSHTFRTSESAPSPDSIRKCGQSLFSALFDRQILRAFDQAQAKYAPMQIRIEIESSQLDQIPWEAMYDDRWLATDSKFSFVRSFGMHNVSTREEATPLRMLVIYALPADGLDRGPVELMQAKLETYLQKLEQDGLALITRRNNANVDDMSTALLPPQDILLFVGHGAPGTIFLHDKFDSAMKYALTPAVLARKINDIPPRMMFLAACQTSVAEPDGGLGFAQALWNAVPLPAIVAMQTFINGGAAGELAGRFLNFVTHGNPVDVALAMAREELIPGTLVERDVFSAVLYLQSPTGDLFSMKERPLEWFAPGDFSLDGGTTWRPIVERIIETYDTDGFRGKGKISRPLNDYSGTSAALPKFCSADGTLDFVLATGHLPSHSGFLARCAANNDDILILHAAFGRQGDGRNEPLHIYVAKKTLKSKRQVAAFLDFFFAKINDLIPQFDSYTPIGSATLEEHRQTIRVILRGAD